MTMIENSILIQYGLDHPVLAGIILCAITVGMIHLLVYVSRKMYCFLRDSIWFMLLSFVVATCFKRTFSETIIGISSNIHIFSEYYHAIISKKFVHEVFSWAIAILFVAYPLLEKVIEGLFERVSRLIRPLYKEQRDIYLSKLKDLFFVSRPIFHFIS